MSLGDTLSTTMASGAKGGTQVSPVRTACPGAGTLGAHWGLHVYAGIPLVFFLYQGASRVPGPLELSS